MKEGNVPVNLSINEDLVKAAKSFIINERRKGRRNLSELTERLWITYLRGKRAKLPPLLKT
jgi:hypothetical protein